MSQIISGKFINSVLVLLLLLSIVPLLALSFYIHPHYDDYDFINKLAGKNIFEATKYWYDTWSGRYSTIFVTNALSVGSKNIFLYRMYPALLMCLYLFVFYKLITRILPQLSFRKTIVFALFFYVLYLYKIPEVTTNLYYMICSYVSSLGTIAFICLLSMLASLVFTTDTRQKVIYTGMGCLASVFIGGSYESTMALSLAFMCITCLILFYKRDPNKWYFVCIAFVLIIFSVLSIVAPGNKIRGGEDLLQTQHIGLLLPALKSVLAGCTLMVNSIQNPLLLLSTLLFIPIAYSIVQTNSSIRNYLDLHPLLVLLCIAGISSASFFPSMWVNNAPARVSNQIYLFILVSWFVFVQSFVVYLIKKDIYISLSIHFISICKLMILICLIPSLTNKTVGRAYSDLLTGKASRFSERMEDRYKLIKSMKEKGNRNIILPPLFEDPESYPLTIYYNYQELSTKTAAPINRLYAKYWDVDSIRFTSTAPMDMLNKTRTN